MRIVIDFSCKFEGGGWIIGNWNVVFEFLLFCVYCFVWNIYFKLKEENVCIFYGGFVCV